MPASPADYPDPAALAAGLTAVFGGAVTVLERRPNVLASTYPSEVVTCRLLGGEVRRVFCKYGIPPRRPPHRRRGGVAYEAAVYRHLLGPSGAAVAACMALGAAILSTSSR